MASTYQILEKAERVELAAEQFYRVLAGRYPGEAKAVFQRLAEEEAQHASRVRLLGARYRQDRNLVTSLAADGLLLDGLLAEVGAATAAVKAGGWDGDAEAALARSAELELRLASVHAQVLCLGANPEVKAFFDQLAAQDRAHHALMKAEAR